MMDSEVLYNPSNMYDKSKDSEFCKQNPSKIEVDASKIFLYNVNLENTLERFKDIDNMSDDDLYNLINMSYYYILEASSEIKVNSSNNEDLSKNQFYMAIMSLFNNIRFITILTNILKSNNNLDSTHRIYMNRIIYNYFTLPPEHKNMVVERLMLDLSMTVNSYAITTLLGIGLDINLACLIAVSRFSSMDDSICVKRVNLDLFNSSNPNITLQTVVDIYQRLFNTCVCKLFEGIMFDAYSQAELEQATEVQRNIYSLQGLAVLELLMAMPSFSIRVILESYYSDYINLKHPPVRFSMKLSNDYYRINEVVDIMALQGIYIP